ncbi:porin [Pseudoduganella sp. SL102]|nr:porin [Pseudoduganella sp. SL102]WBS05792.1 porin [Pseudoduganella sp. SL102]
MTMTSAMMVGAPLTAAAQPVTLYGVLDTGVEYVNHVGPSGRSLTRVPTITGTFPSRWGIRGSEDLGGGMHAVFALESGIGMDTGSVSGGAPGSAPAAGATQFGTMVGVRHAF